jgi:hypothetical protein
MNKDTADNTIDRILYYYKLPIDRKEGNSPLRTFSTETTSQRQILRLNSYTLGMDSGQVGIFEQRYQVCLSGLLQCHHGR